MPSDSWQFAQRLGLLLQDAKAKLLATNIGLVRKLASQYCCREVPFGDLILEGLWGLERGLDEYDPTRNAKVSTAVYWYIRDAVFKAKRLEGNAIHIPLSTQEQVDKIKAAMLTWQRQHPNQAPSDADLRSATGMRPLTLQRVMRANLMSERSLDAPVMGHSTGFGSNKTTNWVDKLACEDFDEEAEELQYDLQAALALLPDPMGVIVQEKYGLLDGNAKNFKEVSSQCAGSAVLATAAWNTCRSVPICGNVCCMQLV